VIVSEMGFLFYKTQWTQIDKRYLKRILKHTVYDT